jgi:hypothetical protein
MEEKRTKPAAVPKVGAWANSIPGMNNNAVVAMINSILFFIILIYLIK